MKSAALALALFAASGAAHAQDSDYAWSVETPKDAEAALRFGLHDTDDQPIAFTCVRGSGQVKVSADLAKRLGVERIGETWVDKAGVRAPWPMSVAMASEGASLTLRGVGHPNDITDGTLVLTEFSTRAPLAAAFRKSGVVSLTAAGESVKPPPAPKGAVRKFLSACK
ncbi:hypothetical protein ASE17_16495 [Phenylobacterium sp. Root77]|jgi:hypothetical protein|uniref:hypothetical protein n=1 Tax=unclassified Phenylobacterium TaxID=2640670 RepID=UPI0006F61B3F|nr:MULTISPECIES: hypothetical protein [unclassified Phenylobacterium]KQW70488.1 hypothetical protein ASC73_10375 [Phenylobacterium sp. Root1277]KQW91091.1 hypothetical protein ASC79_17215 [Phenylobacterium sp. Root1290]KRC39273.1 hypothetical protein ASE17_16495 [Phenylobacterium sp. Root77]